MGNELNEGFGLNEEKTARGKIKIATGLGLRKDTRSQPSYVVNSSSHPWSLLRIGGLKFKKQSGLSFLGNFGRRFALKEG